MVITSIHNFILSNGLEVIGDTFSLVFSAIIFLVGLGLYLYAKAMRSKGVLAPASGQGRNDLCSILRSIPRYLAVFSLVQGQVAKQIRIFNSDIGHFYTV